MLRSMIRAFAVVAVIATGAGAAETGNGGLHKEDWFAVTFRDVAEDIRTASEQGKRLAIVFEQYGCVYCAKMHAELLTDPEIRDYLQANFMIVQYNMFGDEEVTDLDGEVLTEKTAARKWGLLFTPSILFMPEEAPRGKTAQQAAVSVMPGLFGKLTFLDMFRWVREKGYEGDEHFQKYHARRINELRAAGRLNVE